VKTSGMSEQGEVCPGSTGYMSQRELDLARSGLCFGTKDVTRRLIRGGGGYPMGDDGDHGAGESCKAQRSCLRKIFQNDKIGGRQVMHMRFGV
jgi:hypothetical protein